MDKFRDEVKARWGNTEAYREFEKKYNGKVSPEQIMAIFSELGALRTYSPDDNKVQAIIEKLQKFISENFYTCTKEILSDLGEMYVSDERFKKNIDTAGGEGTAELARAAIRIFCGK